MTGELRIERGLPSQGERRRGKTGLEKSSRSRKQDRARVAGRAGSRAPLRVEEDREIQGSGEEGDQEGFQLASWQNCPLLKAVSCSGLAAECLDLLRLFVVEVGELISCFAIRPQ
jgi:hypothetical protein